MSSNAINSDVNVCPSFALPQELLVPNPTFIPAIIPQELLDPNPTRIPAIMQMLNHPQSVNLPQKIQLCQETLHWIQDAQDTNLPTAHAKHPTEDINLSCAAVTPSPRARRGSDKESEPGYHEIQLIKLAKRKSLNSLSEEKPSKKPARKKPAKPAKKQLVKTRPSCAEEEEYEEFSQAIVGNAQPQLPSPVVRHQGKTINYTEDSSVEL
jgi:hypothetical protein